MSLDVSTRRAGVESTTGVAKGVDRAERRRLARQDRVSARLAELHCIRSLLDKAVTVVDAGWVQHSWFTVSDAQGKTRMVTAHNITVVSDQPVAGACLVGAVVHAAGGPSMVRTQLVQRSLDLTWHTLYGDERQPVRWCPPPAIRMANVRDLTAWNDHPGRTASEVQTLLRSAAQTTRTQAELASAR